MIFEICPKI